MWQPGSHIDPALADRWTPERVRALLVLVVDGEPEDMRMRAINALREFGNPHVFSCVRHPRPGPGMSWSGIVRHVRELGSHTSDEFVFTPN